MNYIAANTQKSSWSKDFWLCIQKKEIKYTHFYMSFYVEP